MPLRIAAVAILALACFGRASLAQATFPGTNGSIAYGLEGPLAGQHLLASAFLGPEGRLVADNTTNLLSTGVDRGGDAFDPAWSADGRALAFVSTRGGPRQIYSIGLNFSRSVVSFCGAEVCPITSNFAESYEPAWSFDGQSIVFTSTASGSPQIYRMTATGENVTRLTNDNAIDDQPTWSSTGTIAFVSDLTGTREIYVMSGRGTELRQITHSGVNVTPSWSPNGKEFAYTSLTPAGYQIFVADLVGDEPRRVTSSTPQSRFPKWSPDATKLLVLRGPDSLGRFHLEAVDARSGIGLAPQSSPLIGEGGDWAPLPPAPPRNAPPAVAGVTAIARPLGGKINVNPGHGLPTGGSGTPVSEALAQATPASVLTESVEIPVNSTYDVTHGTVKLTVASGGAHGVSTAVVTGGRFQLIQRKSNALPSIRLLGRPHGCHKRRGRGSVASRGKGRTRLHGHTKKGYNEYGTDGHASTKSTIWEISNTCQGTVYRAIKDALVVTDPHRAHPVRVTAGHKYLVRPGGRR
jgi:dipeptidyl aminopeptidase/acylaminoacyl peptidase